MSTNASSVSDAIPAGRIPVVNPSVQSSSEEPKLATPDHHGTTSTLTTKDADADDSKGAVEDDAPRAGGVKNDSNNSMSGQIGHRNKPDELKNADTDYPEPDSSGEHSGQNK
jgi:hypothetical protein